MKNLLKLSRRICPVLKNNLKMKLSVLFITISLFTMHASDSYGQPANVSLKYENIPVSKLISQIENSTEFRFIYKIKDVDLNRLVSINVEDESINNVLDQLFGKTPTDHRIIKQRIYLFKKLKTIEINTSDTSVIQIPILQSTVTGKITDDTGLPLAGASIVEKGTTNGVVSDFDGNYSINIPYEDVILVVSYVGFTTKEVSLNGQTSLNIQLETDTASLDEVLVVGYRYQNTATIKAKKATVQIADFLTQDNIGRLPDFAAADAARRIAGVSTVFEEDEATQVGIRGLPPIYTFATIDGLAIPSADRSTRVANFEVIPASAISRIEVYKSRTADLDGNSIGGVFNLRTRSAFDSNDRVLIGNFSAGDYDFDEVPRSSRNNADKNGISIRSDLTFADRFGDNDQFGFVFSGSFNRKDRDELKYPRTNYSFLNDNPFQPFPQRIRVNAYDNIIKRYGGFAKFEYKPNDKFYASLSGSFFRKTDSEVRYEARVDDLTIDESSISFNGSSFTEGRNRFGHNIFEIEHQISYLILDSYYKFNDKNKLDFKIGLTKGKRGEDGPGATYRSGTTSDLSGTYTTDNNGAFIKFDNPGFYSDPANYSLIGIDGFVRIDDEDYSSFSMNYGHNIENDSKGWGFKTGYKFRKLNHFFDADRLSISYTGTDPLELSQFLLPETYTPSSFGQSFPLFDPYALNSFIKANPSLFELPTEAEGTLYDRGVIDLPGSEFNIEETINALYGMMSYKGDKFQLFAGLRYEDTKTNTSRPISVNGVFDGTRSDNNNDFNNLLPSLSMVLDISEDVKFKTAYSKAIGRADYGQLSPTEFVDEANNLIFRGNPDLKPRLSNNYDASFEYYYDNGGGIFSLGAFHKSVQDDIITESSIVGENEIFTPVNIDRLAVTGIEINFVKSKLDFLPGFLSDFGLSSNYTFIVGERFLNDGQILAAIPGLPRNTVNSQLFYQREKFDARLAWNWVDETLNSIRTGQEFNNEYLSTYNQWDFAVNYRFTKNLGLFAEVRNLTGENRIFLGGPAQGLTQQVTDYGRSFWLGLNFKL